MLLKIIGSLIIIASSAYIGYVLSREYSRRPQELRELQGMLNMFENEINYMSNLLADAFANICKSANSRLSLIFEDTAKSLKDKNGFNASEAWERAVELNIGKTALDKEDKEILISFGHMLGSSDLEGQIKNIKLTMEQIKLQEEKAEEMKKKYETMYKTLGVLGGIALVIILV